MQRWVFPQISVGLVHLTAEHISSVWWSWDQIHHDKVNMRVLFGMVKLHSWMSCSRFQQSSFKLVVVAFLIQNHHPVLMHTPLVTLKILQLLFPDSLLTLGAIATHFILSLNYFSHSVVNKMKKLCPSLQRLNLTFTWIAFALNH